MKKILLTLMLICASVFSLTLSAQQTLTVGDGTETNSYVPVYGLWMDDYIRAQVIYPSTLLSGMVGSTITQMTFYLSQSPSSAWTSIMEMKLGTCSDATFSGTTFLPAPSETVYTGTLTVANGEMTVVFSTPFVYMGGNLLLEFASQTEGNYSSAYFYGITSTGSSLSGYSSSGVSSVTATARNFLPKATFTYSQSSLTCPSPTNPVVSDITSTEATFSWTTGGTETMWDVYLTTSTDQPDSNTVPTDNAIDTFYTFLNLNPNTVYHTYVRANCGGGDYSYWRSATFRTDCASEISLPYVEDFENDGTGTGTYPRCWKLISNASAVANKPYIYATNHTSGANSMYINSTTNDYSYIVLPPVENNYNMNQVMLSFDYVHFTHPDGKLIIGVMSDDSTITTFEPIDTVYSNSMNYWKFAEVYFDNYTGTGRHIAILSDGRTTSAGNTFCLDYLEVKPAPTCRRPVDIRITDVTPSSITLEWTGNATSWEIAVDTIGYDVDSVQMSYVIATSNPFTLQNLNTDSEYDLYIRGVCGNDHTDWSDRVRFKTTCSEHTTLPIVYDFTADVSGQRPSCMTTMSFSYSNMPMVTHFTSGTDNFLYFKTKNSNAQYAVMSPISSNISLTGLQMVFKGQTTGAGQQIQVGVMTNPYDPATFELVDRFIPSVANAWEEHTTFFDGYTGTGRYIAFKYDNVSTTEYNFYVDTIVVDNIASCFVPRNIEVSNITGSSAYITWDPGIRELQTSYTLEYSESGQNQWTPVTVNESNYLLGGLTQVTSYEVRVRSNCPLSSTDYTYGSFTTGCNAGGEVPVGNGTTTTAAYPLHNNWKYTYTQQIFLASELNGAADFHSIAFEYAYSTSMTSKTNVNIYLGHTPESTLATTSLVPFDSLHLVYSGSLNCHQGWNTFNFDSIFHYNGTDNLVLAVDDNSGAYNGSSYTFYAHAAGATRTVYYYSDTYDADPQNPTSYSGSKSTATNRSNVIFGGNCDNTVTCIAPNVVVNHITDVTADVQIAAGNTETSWEVRYKSADDTVWTSLGLVSTSSLPVTLTGLNPNTDYTVRVKGVCSATENSSEREVSFTTECTKITTLPYTENFDSYTVSGSGKYPECWHINSNYTSTLYPYLNTTTPASGTRCLYFYGTSAYYSIAALPTIDVTQVPINQTMLSFKLRKTTATYFIKVGVMSDPQDYTTFEEVAELTPLTNSAWEEFHVPFNNYTGNGTYIAFACYNDHGTTATYMYVDDVVLNALPACLPPTDLTVSAITQTTADLTWDGGSASEFDVVAVPAGFTIDDMIADNQLQTVYTNSINLTNLNTGTHYTVYVRANCGLDTGVWVHTVFNTECGEISTFPYGDAFDVYGGTGTAYYPQCWTRSLQNTYSTLYPYISGTHHSGVASLYFYGTSSTDYQHEYAMLPRVADVDANNENINISDLQVSFWLYGSNVATEMQVGLIRNPAVDTTFDVVQTFSVTTASTWEPHTVFFRNYTGTGRHVAFRYVNSTSSYYSMYVDDIVLDRAPICSPVNNLEVSSIAGTSALVSWNDGPMGVTTDYTLEYSEHGQDQWTTENNLTTTNFVLSGLNPTTSYDVRVKAACDNGFESGWVTETFTTKCLAGGEMAVGNGTTTEYYYPVNNLYKYSYTQQIYLASELNGAADIRSIAFDYAYATAMTAKTDVKIYLGHTPASTLTTTSLVPYDSLHLVYSGHLNCQQGWNTFNFDSVFHYNGVDNLVVAVDDNSNNYNSSSDVFRAHAAGATRTVYYYSDTYNPDPQNPTSFSGTKSSATNRCNVIFGANCDSLVTCVAPNVMVVNVTENSADIVWADGNGEPDWNIEYKKAGDAAWTSVGSGQTSPYQLTNLSANTVYEVRMQSLCVTGDSSAWNTVNFRTECGLITIPYSEDFGNETASSSSYPACWDSRSTYVSGTSHYPYISATYSHDPNGNSMYFYTSSTTYNLAIMPKIDSLYPVSSLQVKFWLYKSSASYNMVVGVMSDPTNVSTFVPVDTVSPTATSSWQQFAATFENVTNPGQYIAFLCSGEMIGAYNYIYLDDITIDIAPACGAPTALTASNITANAATISWTDAPSESSWQMVYVPQGQEPDYAQAPVVTSNTQALSNLTANTGYDVYVRTVCSNGDGNSDWVKMSFATISDNLAVVPFVIDFSDTTENAEWGFVNGSATNKWYTGTPTGDSHSHLYISNDNGATASYTISSAAGTVWAYRDVQFPQAAEFDLSFSWACQGESTYDYFKVYIGEPTLPVALGVRLAPTDTTYKPAGSAELVQKLNLSANGDFFNTVLDGATYSNTIKRLYFMWTNDGGGGSNPPAIIDSLSIQTRSCSAPDMVTVSSVTTTTATLTLVPADQSDSNWEYVLVAAGQTPTSATPVPTTTATVNLTGLTAATSYDVYARTLCSDNTYSSWSPVTSFTTECGEITLPYSENFDSYTTTGTSSHPLCWTYNSTYGSSYPYISGSYYASGNRSLYFYGSTAGTYSLIAAPEIASTYAMNRVKVTVKFRPPSYTSIGLIVGAMTNPMDATTFVAMDTLYNTSTSAFEQHTVSFAPYTGTGHYVAFMSYHPSNTGALYMDDVLIEEDTTIAPPTPTCDAPTGLAVAASSITQTSATATWTAGGTETAWDVQVKEHSATAWGNEIPTQATSYNITGLTAGTQYDVRVRANCGDATSDWTTVVTFQTQSQGPGPDPCNAPTGLTATNMTKNSVVLDWTENGTATSWTVNYKEENAAQWSTTTASAHPYTLTGLQPATNYSVYVVANCANGQSDPSNTATFTTEPDGIAGYEQAISLYPNPNNGQFTVNSEQGTVNRVQIYDVYGKLLKTVEVNGNMAELDVRELTAGMYFVRINTEKGVVTKSFVKK
ncbi:MAG: fibronectin type III domain-containing protein [Bacteroidales bacterium]|nr:fibronectin type III domain-containing protein [Bacteroidales bacterium]